ncbi:hypothetical protein ACFX13_022823 [Malus domestica]
MVPPPRGTTVATYGEIQAQGAGLTLQPKAQAHATLQQRAQACTTREPSPRRPKVSNPRIRQPWQEQWPRPREPKAIVSPVHSKVKLKTKGQKSCNFKLQGPKPRMSQPEPQPYASPKRTRAEPRPNSHECHTWSSPLSWLPK